jgi:MFS family permease
MFERPQLDDMDLHSGTLAGEDRAAGGKHPYSENRKQLFLLGMCIDPSPVGLSSNNYPGLFPLSEHIAWSSIFPYIYTMVQSISPSTDHEGHNSAFYAALLVSAFTFGEFLMAPQWAKISDRVGRKPTLLIGSVGAMFSAAAFGLSISLPMAITARICAGMLNPNLGVLKTYVGELVSKDKQGGS